MPWGRALTKKTCYLRNLSEKKIVHKKVPEKKIKHACSLNLSMNRYLKIQEKIDLLNLEQTFIIIPQDCSNKSAMKTFSGPF